MTTRTLRKCCIVLAVILLAGPMARTTPPATAGEPQSGIALTLARAGAIAPRFRPAQPSELDEFVDIPKLQKVHFEFDKSATLASEAKLFDENARWLKNARWLEANPPYEILIEAYADERGSTQYNLALAERRAMSVRNQLVARGVEPGRITLAAYGKDRRACGQKTEACWSQNRRADIMLRRPRAQNP